MKQMNTFALQKDMGLENIILASMSCQYSFAVWKNPFEKTIYGFISSQGDTLKNMLQIEESKPCFIFSPFCKDDNYPTLQIYSDFYFQITEENIEIETTEVSPEKKDFFISTIKNIETKNRNTFIPFYINESEEVFFKNKKSTSQKYYKNIVQKGIEYIEKKHFQKVVLSRFEKINTTQDFNIFSCFTELLSKYPSCFLSFIGIPQRGLWMGATPEILLSTEKKRWFKTVALAGTQKIPHNSLLENMGWKQKEIEEQALVSRYIVDCFKKIRLREFQEIGPKIVSVGNIAHIKTEFLVDMQETNFPHLASTMLPLIHPTSAVCGMPLDTSLKFIKEYEDFRRSFFTGYLGYVNKNENTNISVNIRCMQILNNCVILYAGAGITAESIPQKEWKETELKMDSIKKIILNKK